MKFNDNKYNAYHVLNRQNACEYMNTHVLNLCIHV